MLERATICSKHGARHARSLSGKLTRSRRSLHCAFWAHGAGDINLPSWWFEYLRRPLCERPSLVQRISKTARRYLPTVLRSSFLLEFLYPPKTLSLASRILVQQATLLARRQRSGTVRREHRYFASHAPENPAGEKEENSQRIGRTLRFEDDAEVNQTVTEALKRYGVIQDESVLSEVSAELPPETELEDQQATEAVSVSPSPRASDTQLRDLIQRSGSYRRLLGKLTQMPEFYVNPSDLSDKQQRALQTQLTAQNRHGSELASHYVNYMKEHVLPSDHNLWAPVDFARIIQGMYLSRRPKHHFKRWVKISESEQLQMFFSQHQALNIFKVAIEKDKAELALPLVLDLTFSFGDWRLGGLALHYFRKLKGLSEFSTTLSKFNLERLGRSIVSMCRAYKKMIGRSANRIGYFQSRSNILSPLMVVTINSFLRHRIPVTFDPLLVKQVWDALTEALVPNEEQYRLAIRQLLSPSGTLTEISLFTIQAYRLWEETRSIPDFQHEQDSLEMLFKRLRHLHHKGAIEVFNELKEKFGTPSSFLYRIMLRELSYHGETEKFVELLQDMTELHGVARLQPYLARLITAFARRADIVGAERAFDSIRSEHGLEPDVDCWNAMIAAHIRVNDVPKALEWFSQMQEQGFQPQLATNRIILRAYCSRGEVDAAEEFLQELREKGHLVDSSLVTSLVFAHVQNNNLDEAEKMLIDAVSEKIPGNKTQMWNTVLYAHGLQRNILDMYYVHHRMIELGIPEDNMTYAALIQGFSSANRANLAMKILTKTMAQKRLVPTSFHFAIVIQGFIRTREYHLAFEASRRMKEFNLEPDFSTKTLLMRAVVGQSEKDVRLSTGWVNYEEVTLDSAEKLLNYLLESESLRDVAIHHPIFGTAQQNLTNVYASNYFETLILAYGRQNAFDKVAELFDRYLTFSQTRFPDSPVSPPIRMLSALMLAYRNQHNHDEVENCWNLAYTKARELAARTGADTSQPGWVLPSRRYLLSSPLYHYMHSLLSAGRGPDIAPLFASLTTAGFMPDSACWNLHVQTLCLSGAIEAAFRAAEQHLIAGFPGWPRWKRFVHSPESFLKRKRPEKHGVMYASPNYRTLVVLARGYMNLRARHAFDDDSGEKLRELEDEAPDTVRAVVMMPRVDDEVQMRYLRGT